MSAEVVIEEEEQGASLLEYINILRRRKKLLAIVFGVVMLVGIAVAFLWPAKYQSEAVILIQGQDIPSSLVQTTITSFAQQRIEQIKQRIMTTGNIMEIVEQFSLYTEKELERKPRTEIANEFREAVSVEPISADIVDPQSGRAREAVIAFNLAFESKAPAKAAAVANELTNLFLNENLKERSEKTKSTSAFLESESKILLEKVEELEGQIAEFKEENKQGLPEFQNYNIGVVERTEDRIRQLEFELSELEKSKLKLEDEIATISPTAPVVLPTGEKVLGDADRLKALESELRRKSAIYREDHPDLLRLKRSIEELLESGVTGGEQEDKARQWKTERDKLAGLEQKYTEDHPQIIETKRIIADLESELGNAIKTEAEISPDNPAYLIINNQLNSVEKDIRANAKLKEDLTQKLEQYRTYVSQGPQLEKQLAALIRELRTTQEKYSEIRSKLLHAELAQNLETEQKGERFTLIQPAEVPREPVSPNRPAIIFLAVVLALGVSVGSAILVESVDGAIYGQRVVANILGAPPLVSIGYMESPKEHQAHMRLRIYMLVAAVLAVVLFFVFFHNFVKPLDVTWYLLMRRMGIGA